MTKTPYGLDPSQLLRYVIRPTLHAIGCHSRAAEVLVLGTGMVESGLRFIDQKDKADKPGPAFGIFQMEGFTHADLYRSYLATRRELRAKLLVMAGDIGPDSPDPGTLVYNLRYAAAMCRVRYLPARPSLPAATDARALAEYHKAHYNTPLGKTVVSESVKHFEYAISVN